MLKDYSGVRFGMVVVVRRARRAGAHSIWLVRCDCGRTSKVWDSNLRKIKSCGCQVSGSAIRKSHGKSGTPEHKCWKGMRRRCNCKTDLLYKHYGARGIKVCKRWDSFKKFLEDMGPMPAPKMTVERKDVNKGYCPSNCCWLPKSRQNRNRRDTVRVTYQGRTQGLVDWCEELGLPQQTIRMRHARGFRDDLLFAPVVPGKRLRRTKAQRGY